MRKEEWKEVVGFEGLYEVSSFGDVRSLDRVVKHRQSGYITLKGRVKKKNLDKSGYFRVTLSKNGNGGNRLVHQLVAEAFLGHKRVGMNKVINHIDSNKINNSIFNLEITSHRDNCIHRSLNQNNSSRYVGVSFAKNQNKWVAKIRVDGISNHLGYFDNEIDASQAYINKLETL